MGKIRYFAFIVYLYALCIASCGNGSAGDDADTGTYIFREAGMDGSELDAGNEGGPDSNSETGTIYDGSIRTIPCEDVEGEWEDSLGKSLGCNSHDDCMIFFPTRDGSLHCECTDSLGDPMGTVLSKSAIREAREYMDRYFSPDCDGLSRGGGCDGTPLEHARCENGRCVGYESELSCGMTIEVGRGWGQCNGKCLSPSSNEECPLFDPNPKATTCDTPGLRCWYCSRYDFVPGRIDAVCIDGRWSITVLDCDDPIDTDDAGV